MHEEASGWGWGRGGGHRGQTGGELESPTFIENSLCAEKQAELCRHISFLLHFIHEEVEAQREHRTCPKSHSLKMMETGFEPVESAPESHVRGVRLNLRLQIGGLRGPTGLWKTIWRHLETMEGC